MSNNLIKPNFSHILLIALWGSLLVSCGDDEPNLFSVEDDVSVSGKLYDWVLSDTLNSVLDEASYASTYDYADNVFNYLIDLVDSNSVSLLANKDLFNWELVVIQSSELNGFAMPGGLICVNTGLINLMSTEDEFASMLMHLILHSDNRDVTKQMLQEFSNEELLNAASGNSESSLDKIGTFLLGRGGSLSYSISDERELDETMVQHLSLSKYACNAHALFIETLENRKNQGDSPAFLSGHQDIADRLTTINDIATELGCNTEQSQTATEFQAFKGSLP
ncbi:M48 family metalloprotease [Marinoscillum sp. MHG1-6]|uniref:M48 family metalloprotease n=1 Tax=Marinoscillum sp. MHG1-6 TaxID=2959627 RepID=UPI002157AF13|nr:M48 family metalloprotease [Marinoscillum sp. MHG1-6]